MSAYLMQTHRLALGLDFVDAMRWRELGYPVRADIERGIPHRIVGDKKRFGEPLKNGQVPVMMNRHRSGRHSLLYFPGIADHVDVRIYEFLRHYVPRRLRIPLLTLEQVTALETAQARNFYQGRVREPMMYPGAAYPCHEATTGLRGRVLRDGVPMRWTHIEARLVADDSFVGRARGDDRGEFLLVLFPAAAPASDLPESVLVRISVFGPEVIPEPASVEVSALDPWWDLPLEILPAAGDVDDVSSGAALPVGYAEGATVDIEFPLGRMLSAVEVDDFIFELP